MTDQTKAQRLAGALLLSYGNECPTWRKEQASAELLRLDANEVALLEALKHCVEDSEEAAALHVQSYGEKYRPKRLAYLRTVVAKARALITRVEAERNAK